MFVNNIYWKCENIQLPANKLTMDSLIAKLYQSNKTILTSKDLALVWGENNQIKLKDKISYYVRRGVLIRLTRGVFAKDKNFNAKELATSLYTPSYQLRNGLKRSRCHFPALRYNLRSDQMAENYDCR